MQHEYLSQQRDAATVFEAGVATRQQRDESIDISDQVKTVVWENPVHHDPRFNPETVALSKEEYAAFERGIREFCEARGAKLVTFAFWRDDQTDDEWQELMLRADIAIECKGLDGRYSDYQLQKPATKLQNYLSLGLPVVCDSLPSYTKLGAPAGVMFANTMEEWFKCLSMLFESRDLRAEMRATALEAVAPISIANVAKFHVESFRQMLTAFEAASRA